MLTLTLPKRTLSKARRISVPRASRRGDTITIRKPRNFRIADESRSRAKSSCEEAFLGVVLLDAIKKCTLALDAASKETIEWQERAVYVKFGRASKALRRGPILERFGKPYAGATPSNPNLSASRRHLASSPHTRSQPLVMGDRADRLINLTFRC
jgi:hypothetical protein